jgi:O-antigen/teichoic acid export membrane protein
MNLGESIRSGVKWLMFGNVGMRFIEFAFGVILARLLVPADFGMIVTISVFTGFVSMLSSGGMGQSLIRAKDAGENDFCAVFTMQLGLGIAIYLGFFIAAPWVAQFFENPLYADLLRVSALSFLMRPFAFMRTSWLNREMDFKRRSVVDVATTGLTSVVSVAMAWAGLGVWSLVLSGLIGSLGRNIMLARITPLHLRLNFDYSAMRKHSGYGVKITTNDFLSYLTREGKNLVLSKMAGPAFLGLFNKSESLSRLPNQMFMSSTVQPVFRAMSKVQDDLDQTKYMFYRVISLLMVYTMPLYVGLWWVAEPFIQVVYGEKWLAAAEPMRILVISGIFLNIMHPSATLLDAQNRLTQEMFALVIRLIVTLAACVVGLQWGLIGVAWAITFTNAFSAVYYYLLVRRTIRTRYTDLFNALAPGLSLSGLLFAMLAAVHYASDGLDDSRPAIYLSLMILAGGLTYLLSFLYIPISSISGEAQRWRNKIGYGLKRISRAAE